VPRTRSPERLDAIVDAARAVFTSVSYRRARMSDVATAAGVSPGLLYTYADSKAALFSLVIRRVSGSTDLATLELPVATPEPEELTRIVGDAFARLGDFSALERAEATDRPGDVGAELEAIVGQQFDSMMASQQLLRLIERCALDWPELATSFYAKSRRDYLDRLERLLGRRAEAGLLAPVDDLAIAARFVVETVAWFASHRFGDHDGAELDDDAVRREVLSLVTRALLGS